MCAITPMLRNLLRSGREESLAMAHSDNSLAARGAVATRALVSLPLPSRLNNYTRLPREVGEGLVGVGHLDRGLALGHGLALLAVGGHQFVGQALAHCLAGLAAGRPDDPPQRQALLADRADLHRHLVRGSADSP